MVSYCSAGISWLAFGIPIKNKYELINQPSGKIKHNQNYQPATIVDYPP